MSFIHNKDLQDLITSIALVTDLPICLHDENFQIITGFNTPHQTHFCRYLQQIPELYEKCRDCDIKYCKEANRTKNITIYKCHAGLIEAIAPIVKDGVVCGYIMSGQITNAKDPKAFTGQLAEYCTPYIDKETILNLSRSIKHKTDDQIFAIAQLLDICANHIQLKQLIQPAEQRLINLIDEYIENHLSEDISINDLCFEFKTSRSRLYAAVSTQINGGIAAYIKRKRLLTAKKLLDTTGLSTSEIAEKVGFSDHNYFSKAFKKHYGISPKQYRIQNA